MAQTSAAARPTGGTIPAPDKIPVALTVNGVETQLKSRRGRPCSTRCATIST